MHKIIDNNEPKRMKRDIKVLLAKVERKLNHGLHERPSQETLNRLALFVGFQDWESFQRELHEGQETNTDDSQTHPNDSQPHP